MICSCSLYIVLKLLHSFHISRFVSYYWKRHMFFVRFFLYFLCLFQKPTWLLVRPFFPQLFKLKCAAFIMFIVYFSTPLPFVCFWFKYYLLVDLNNSSFSFHAPGACLQQIPTLSYPKFPMLNYIVKLFNNVNNRWQTTSVSSSFVPIDSDYFIKL